jgi:hypothetical protein
MLERRKTDCARVTFPSRKLHLLYALLVYFSTPYLSIPGGIAIALWVFPSTKLGAIYALLWHYAPAWVIGLLLGVMSLISWVVIMRIGPRACGVCLPNVQCFSRKQLRSYSLFMLLQWLGLSAVSTYSFYSFNPLGGITYALLGVSILIRVAIATTGLKGYG